MKLQANKIATSFNNMYHVMIGCDVLLISLYMIMHILEKELYPRNGETAFSFLSTNNETYPSSYRGITMISCFAKQFTVNIGERFPK